jgi:hypothetical protein
MTPPDDKPGCLEVIAAVLAACSVALVLAAIFGMTP